MTFKAAAIQMCSGVDPEKNAADMERLVREAASQGAVYVLMAVLRDEANDVIVATARDLARDLGIHVHVGSTAIALPDGKIANRGFLFAPGGERICTYDKIHMFDVDLDNGESWRESAVYRPGGEARVAELPFAKLGFAICYDVRFPSLFRTEAVAGAEVLTVPAAFTRQTGEAHWEVLMRARAIENGAFVIAAAQAGVHEDGRETFGHSMIIDPWGKVLASAGGSGEAIVIAEIDVDQVKAARGKIPNLKNARDFTLDTVASEAKGVAA